MSRLYTVVFTVLALFLSASLPAYEAEVEVNESAANAIEARTHALNKAERAGFEAILREQSPEKAEQLIQDYADFDISPYVMGYQAKKEVVTNTRYRATLVIDYDDYFIRNVLRQQVGRPANTTNQPTANNATPGLAGNGILLIPVYRTKGQTYLWEAENQWRDIVNAAVLRQKDIPFITPYGDPTDKLSLNPTIIDAVNFARLTPLLQRYGSQSVIIATAQQEVNGSVNLVLRKLDMKGEEGDSLYIPQEGRIPAKVLLQRSVDALMNSMLLPKHLRQSTTQTDKAPRLEIPAHLMLSSAGDWGELRKRLKQIDAIERFDILSADAEGIALSITFKGQPEMLGEALLQSNIRATQREDTLWLSLR